MRRTIVGLDIGGANLKASDGLDRSLSRSFAVWRHPERLAAALADLLAEFPRPGGIAVTMTAELADCYRTKEEGVARILEAVTEASEGQELFIWQTGGEFVTADEALELTPLVAAANWHALATWASRSLTEGTGLLIDIGSTTADIIPLAPGIPLPHGRTDTERLLSGELVYSGVRRTPLCALVRWLPVNGQSCAVAAELFATTLDVYLLLGDIAENERDLETANGRPTTREEASDRLVRMVCADATEIGPDDARAMAEACREAHEAQLADALDRVIAACESVPRTIVLSGEGTFLARRLVENRADLAGAEQIDLATLLGPHHAQAACAFALARLARERVIAS